LDLRVRPRQSSWWKPTWTGSVKKLVTAKLAWMPVSLSWNEQPLERPKPLSVSAEALVYALPAERGDLWLPIGQSARQRRVRCGEQQGDEALALVTEIDHGLGYRGWAVLGANASSWSKTTFVLHGVALDCENNLLDRPGIVAVISAAGLSSDLGGLKVVHDQAFRERLQSLRSEVRWLDSLNQTGH
jgi:hypothetical protein